MTISPRLLSWLPVLAGLAALSAPPVGAALWSPEPTATSDDTRFPDGTFVFTLDPVELDALLDRARPEPRPSAGSPSIRFPMPDGTQEEFSFHRSAVLAPELAAKFPEIRPFAGLGRSGLWRVRFEQTPNGFSAAVWTPAGRVLIEPTGEANRYASVYAADLPAVVRAPRPSCDVESDPAVELELAELVSSMERGGGVSNGEDLRTYRCAIAATGEYTSQHGGTVLGGMAGIASTLNRLNEIMGREWAVALELVPNNDLVVYTDPNTDPYSNGDLFTMLGQNQANLNSVIGNANYDIGHVFGTGGGGVASLASVCNNNSKGRGVSTSFNTNLDGFNLLVAHEMGHQFGGSHTFNGTEGNCGPNRSASSAYEPGSGSTIMSYAGNCGSQSIQWESDDYYHTRTYEQVVANITGGTASGCPVVTPTGNSPPVALIETGGFTIPLDTAFKMEGSGTDADGDSLTYCWEQYNRGPAGHPDEPEGDAPIFRSFNPRMKTFRDFPKIGRTVNNDHRIGEIRPTYARTLTFRLTVRDNLGGVDYDSDDVIVVDTAGPFRVTSQSTTELWAPGSQQTVTWDVANTDNIDVNCQTVDILLAENQTSYDIIVLAGTPNDGSAQITVPAVETSEARIMVKAADNIFYDVNDADILILSDPSSVDVASGPSAIRLHLPRPNPFTARTTVGFTIPGRTSITLGIYDVGGRLVTTLLDEAVPGGTHSVVWDGTSRSGRNVAPGVYYVRLETDRTGTQTRKLQLIR